MNVLQASPGMSAHLVQRASNMPLRATAATRRHAYIQPPEPHLFRLRCDEQTHVDVGPSLFTLLELQHGIVHRIRSTDQLAYATRDAAHALATQLIERLLSAGFEANERIDPQAWDRTAATFSGTRVCLLHAPFGSGQWLAEVWLRQATPVDEGYLVTLVVEDQAQREGWSL